MIAFIEGGMMLSMGRVTRAYLIVHRLCPYQCVPNLFRVLGSVDALNKQMGLRLTWLDVVYMYECHSLADLGYYLKSRSSIVRLISCLPKSTKGMKDDYLIVSRNGTTVFTAQLGRESQVGCPRVRSLDTGFSSLVLLLYPLAFDFFLMMGFVGLTVILLLGCFYR